MKSLIFLLIIAILFFVGGCIAGSTTSKDKLIKKIKEDLRPLIREEIAKGGH